MALAYERRAVPVDERFHPAKATLALGDGFFDVVRPASFPEAKLRFRNQRWAERVGLGTLEDQEWLDHFARFQPLPGSLPEPLALRYHGHQFRSYNPRLGDGRGFLFAQLIDPEDQRLLDLGTKGSGQTPWSRDGDGKLTLKGGVREVLATEMLDALGVNTSKTFSLVETGEVLERNDEPYPARSSVLTRLSHGHVRFGSFQRLAFEGNRAGLARLLDFCVQHYFPEVPETSTAERARLFVRAVARRSAATVGQWMAAGFVHGVLNTDNLNVTGESFDYGPYRFLPVYDPGFTAAYFDSSGLYAFGKQTESVRWNLGRLVDALALIGETARLESELSDFEVRAMQCFHLGFLGRLGVEPVRPVEDALFVSRCLCFLQESRVGYDRFFFDWQGGGASEERARRSPAASSYDGPRWRVLRDVMLARIPRSPEVLRDPYFDREEPTTLLIDGIEAIWTEIAERDDWSTFNEKIVEIRALGRLFGR